MCFNVKHKYFVLYLCNQPVNLVEHETYLGNDIASDILIEAFLIPCIHFIKKVIISFQILEY